MKVSVAGTARRGGLSSVVALSCVLGATTPVTAGVTQSPPYPSSPARLAVGGPGNHLYTLFAVGSPRVTESDASGAYLRDVDVGVDSLNGFEVDASGNLYLAFRRPGSDHDVLRKISPSGSLVWETPLSAGAIVGDVSAGSSVIWVLARQPPRVDAPVAMLKFSPETGGPLGSFPASGSAVEGLPNGNVLSSSFTTGMTEYNPDGSVLRTLPGAIGAIDSTASGEVIATVATSGISSSVRKLAADGSSTLGLDGGATSLAVTPSGETWALRGGILFHLDPRTPDAMLTVSEARTLTGAPVVFDATGSFVPFTSPSRYEWDLDGDGSFETDSGPNGRVSQTYGTAGGRTVTVRVTAPAGGTATASTALDVSTSSPAGPFGVSVNEGAKFTNDPHVSVFMRWPTFAKDVVISNDGGFFPASQRPVGATVAWTLDSSGPEGLPKTIYARFVGGQSGPETYQDDIILDETAPVVVKAVAREGAGSVRLADLARRLAKRRYSVMVKARDETSGVARMQITSKKAKSGPWRAYKKKSTFKTSSIKIFARVQDRAGNVSRWKRLKIA